MEADILIMVMAHIHLKSKRLIFWGAFLILATIGIIGSIPYFVPPHRLSGKEEKILMARMRVNVSLEGAMQYKKKFGHFPENAKELFSGIQLLQGNPSILAGWTNSEGELIDPWGKVMEVKNHGHEIEVESSGPDNKRFTSDDIMATAKSEN